MAGVFIVSLFKFSLKIIVFCCFEWRELYEWKFKQGFLWKLFSFLCLFDRDIVTGNNWFVLSMDGIQTDKRVVALPIVSICFLILLLLKEIVRKDLVSQKDRWWGESIPKAVCRWHVLVSNRQTGWRMRSDVQRKDRAAVFSVFV